MTVPGAEFIVTTALKSLVGKIVGVVVGQIGDAIKPALLRRAVENAVLEATREAAQKVGRPGASALADSLVEQTGHVILRMLSEQRSTLSSSEDIDEFEAEFLANYPADVDESISPFSRNEAREFLDTFLEALDQNLWSTEPLRALRVTAGIRQIEQTMEMVAEQIVPETDIKTILQRAIAASTSDLERFWIAHGRPAVLVERTMVHQVENRDDRVDTGEMIKRIRPGWRARLVAEPGAGKTTWLLVLAESLLADEKRIVVAVLPLKEISHGLALQL